MISRRRRMTRGFIRDSGARRPTPSGRAAVIWTAIGASE